MPVSYRQLQSFDAPKYREIRLQSLRENPDVFEADYYFESQQPQLTFEKRLIEKDTDSFIVGAWLHDQLIGICTFVNKNNEAIHGAGTLIQMFVKSAFRRQGIGLALVNYFVQQVIDDGRNQQIILAVSPDNYLAKQLYHKAGFRLLRQQAVPRLDIFYRKIDDKQ
ncbi:GNAT family N-acetyltransferase [Aliikangiella maris]|uniref:GNAT family N-acetyltransferase n=2 Tax=Aliikangiella maris TaxID=3162458 RepID=A0ABV3MPL0_9GAMM